VDGCGLFLSTLENVENHNCKAHKMIIAAIAGPSVEREPSAVQAKLSPDALMPYFVPWR